MFSIRLIPPTGPKARATATKGLEIDNTPFQLSGGSPYTLGSLGHAYAVSGNREKARQALADLRELSQRRYVAPFESGLIYAGLGEKERALEWLEKAFQDRSWGMTA